MARTFTAPSLQDLLAQESDECWVALLTISHTLLPQPLRICSDLLPLIRHDATLGLDLFFFGWRFDVQQLSDNASEVPRSQFICDNVDPRIGDAIQGIAGKGPCKIRFSLVRRAAPETLEVDWQFLTMRSVKVDDDSISGTLTYEDLLGEPLTAQISPSTVPGVFG